jgi:hypothetical protein
MRRDQISVFLKKIAGVLIGLWIFSAVQAATYYSGGSLTPNNVNNWWTNTNATGSHPANFTTAGDVFIIQNSHSMTSAASWTVTGTVQINLGGTFTGTAAHIINIGSILVSGTCNNNSSQAMVTTTLTVNGTFNNNNLLGINATTITVNGIFNDVISGHITGTMTVNSGGTYDLKGNTSPVIATATWNTGSNCIVSGITNASSIGGTAQTFYNFTWSSANSRGLTFSPVTINGSLVISNGGGGRLSLGVTTLAIGQNFSVSGANTDFAICRNTSAAITVSGNMTVTAGSITMSRGSGTGTINLYGDFTHTGGTITETSTGRGAFIFRKSGVQTYTSGGTLSNAINFTVNSASTLQMGTGASPAVIPNTCTGTFTLASGATLGVTSTVGITTSGNTGNIRLTGTRTFTSGANYIYNGNANQACGSGLTQNRPNNLEINNSGNTVSLSAALIISGSLIVTAGTLNLAGFTANVGDLQGSGTIRNNVAGAVSITTGSNDANSTFSGIIQNGTGTVSLVKNGSGNLTLSNANTFSGGGSLNAGTITLGATNALTTTSSWTINGGTLNTGVTGYSNTTSGTLNLASNTSLDLGSGSHTLTFANSSGISWSGGANLTVSGWTGGYNSTAGTGGRLFVGSTAAGLTTTQLKQVQFRNGSDYYKATILASGEVVPTSTILVLHSLSYNSPNTFLQTTPITPLIPTITGDPNSYSVNPALPDGLSLNTTTGEISGTPTTSTPTATYEVTASDGPNQTSFGIVITVHVPTTYYARASGFWDALTTWSTTSADGAAATTLPTTGDIVNIGNGAAAGDRSVTIPLNTDALCATLNIGGNSRNNSLILLGGTSTLTVSGNVTINTPTWNRTNSLNISDGTAAVSGNFTLYGNSTSTSRITSLLVTNGGISINGNLVLGAGTSANTARVDLSAGAGTLNLGGAFTVGTAGRLTAGTLGSNFNFNGTSAQTVPLNDADIVYNNLLINNTVSATLNAAITTSNVTGNLIVENGLLYNGGFAIALNSTNDFSVLNASTFRLTGTSSMVTGANSLTFDPTSYTTYDGGNQTVSNQDYGNLYLGGTGTKAISSGATIHSDLYIFGTTTVTAGAAIITSGDFTISNGTTFTAGAFNHSVGLNFLNSGTFTAGTSTFTFDGSAPQNIGGTITTNFNDVVFSGTDATLTSSISARNFTIDPSVSVTTGAFSHSLSGNFTNDGFLVGTGGTLTFNGSTPQTIGGSVGTTFNNLVISNSSGVALNTSEYITAANLTINSGSLFTIPPLGKLEVTSTLSNLAGSSGLLIAADATGSGSLIHSTAGVNATVQQYLTDNSATYFYHTNSSPVTNALASVFLIPGAGPYLYYYNPASAASKWINTQDINTPLNPGKGYLINYKTQTTAETISFAGPLNTGNIDIPLVSDGDGNNLIGNPYPCSIDWDSPSGWTLGSTDDYITIWNPTDGSYGSYVRGVGTGTHGVTNIIPSGQGFFVHTPANTTLSMSNAVKVHDNSLIKSSNIGPVYFKLRVTNDTNSFNDEIIIYYRWDATKDFDSRLEAKKVFSIMKESSQIYTQSDEGTNLAINALPEEDKDSIVLYFKCGIHAGYTIKMVESSGVDLVNLTDLFTGKNENLLTNEYKFLGSPSDTVIRFVINSQMGGNTKINVIPVLKSEEVSIKSKLNGLYLQNLTSQPLPGCLTITSLLGRTIHKENITLATEESRSGFDPGIYIVSFTTAKSNTVKKILIR